MVFSIWPAGFLAQSLDSQLQLKKGRYSHQYSQAKKLLWDPAPWRGGWPARTGPAARARLSLCCYMLMLGHGNPSPCLELPALPHPWPWGLHGLGTPPLIPWRSQPGCKECDFLMFLIVLPSSGRSQPLEAPSDCCFWQRRGWTANLQAQKPAGCCARMTCTFKRRKRPGEVKC